MAAGEIRVPVGIGVQELDIFGVRVDENDSDVLNADVSRALD